MIAGTGSPETRVPEADIASILAAGVPDRLFAGRRVLVLTPDATRTCPLPAVVRAVRDVIGARCARLDFMVALGTHSPLSEARILKLYGIDRAADFPHSSFFNHDWDRPDTFRRLALLSEAEVERISEGLLREEVPVDINRPIFDYDQIVVLGPVFPHEVVGLLRRGQVPLPRHLRRRVPALLPLAGGGRHLPGDHRHQAHAGAARSSTGPWRFVDVPRCTAWPWSSNRHGVCTASTAATVREAWSQAADLSGAGARGDERTSPSIPCSALPADV